MTDMTDGTQTREPHDSAHDSALFAQVRNLQQTTTTLIQRLEQTFKLADQEREAAVQERRMTMETTRLMQTVIQEQDARIEQLEAAIRDLGDIALTLAAAVRALQES
jgi:uncharacterized protein YoxC